MKLKIKRISIACGKIALSALILPIGLACGAICGIAALIGVAIGFPIYGLMVLWEDGLE